MCTLAPSCTSPALHAKREDKTSYKKRSHCFRAEKIHNDDCRHSWVLSPKMAIMVLSFFFLYSVRAVFGEGRLLARLRNVDIKIPADIRKYKKKFGIRVPLARL